MMLKTVVKNIGLCLAEQRVFSIFALGNQLIYDRTCKELHIIQLIVFFAFHI